MLSSGACCDPSGTSAHTDSAVYPSPEDKLRLSDPQWDDVHVITGALKLFFRELPEPLIPYSLFDEFIAAVSKCLSCSFSFVTTTSMCNTGLNAESWLKILVFSIRAQLRKNMLMRYK